MKSFHFRSPKNSYKHCYVFTWNLNNLMLTLYFSCSHQRFQLEDAELILFSELSSPKYKYMSTVGKHGSQPGFYIEYFGFIIWYVRGNSKYVWTTENWNGGRANRICVFTFLPYVAWPSDRHGQNIYRIDFHILEKCTVQWKKILSLSQLVIIEWLHY